MLRVIAGLGWLVVCATAAHSAPFAKDLAPPRVFDGIRAGTSLADAKAALAQYEPDAGYRDAAARSRLVRDAGDGARYYVLVKDGVVSRIGIEAPQPGLVERLARLWGKPSRATNLANEAITSWATRDWRVDVACRGSLCRLAWHQPLTASFFGTAVAPPAQLTQVKPWMQKAELVRLVPRYASGTEIAAGPEDVRLALDVTRDGRLRSILIGGLPTGARGVIEQAWGATIGDVWWNPSAGWRAQLDDSTHTLLLFPYVPAAKLFGPGVGIAAFPRPILGATRDQIGKAYPAVITLPPIEDGIGPTAVAISFNRDDRASKLVIVLPFATPARRDELVKLLEAKWGAAKQTAQTYVFPTSALHIEARESSSTLELTLAL